MVNFDWISEHGTSLAALVTAIGAAVLNQRKLSIKESNKLKTNIETHLKAEMKKTEARWLECEKRDTHSKIKIRELELRLDDMSSRLDDCERARRVKKEKPNLKVVKS